MKIVKKIKPLFTSIVTTMEKYGVDELKDSVLIDPKKSQGALKEIQKVVAIGDSVREVKVGDYIKINPSRYAVKKYKEDSVKADLMTQEILGYNIPQVEFDNQTFLMLQANDIEYIVLEFEEEKPDTGLIHTEPHIIH